MPGHCAGLFFGFSRDKRLARLANVLLVCVTDNTASYHRTVYKGPSGQPRRAFVTAGHFYMAQQSSKDLALLFKSNRIWA